MLAANGCNLKLKLMRRRFSWFVGWLGLAVGPWAVAGPGYLPTVGPAPLRFADPVVLTAARVPLPPLEADARIATVPPTPPPETKAIPPPVELEPPPPARLVPAGNTAATAPPPPDAAPPSLENTLFSPQMLLPYFTSSGTNAAGVSVLIPLNFQPPLPSARPPSSSATYEVVPASKP